MQSERTCPSLPKSERYVFVQWLRVLAAFGIVVFHAYDRQPGLIRSVGYFGLPAFLSIFSALLINQPAAASFSSYVQKRAKRLLLPWLFWSCVYWLTALTKTHLIHKPDSLGFSLCTILTGTSIHLWYLPYAFLVSLVLYGFVFFQTHWRHLFQVVCGTAFLLSLVLSSYGLKHGSLPVPFPQWLFGTPAVFYGLLVMSVYQKASFRTRLAVGLALILATELFLAVLYRVGFSGLLISYGIACPLTGAAFWAAGARTPAAAAALKGGDLTYGVYLIHPLLLSAFRFVLGGTDSWFSVLSVFAISLGLTYILKQTRMRIFV